MRLKGEVFRQNTRSTMFLKNWVCQKDNRKFRTRRFPRKQKKILKGIGFKFYIITGAAYNIRRHCEPVVKIMSIWRYNVLIEMLKDKSNG